MPRTSTSVTFSRDEILDILARESGLDPEHIEVEGWDEDETRFGQIAELTVSQRIELDEPSRVVCFRCNVHDANDNGDLLCDTCEAEVSSGQPTVRGPSAEASEPELCKACNQNRVREIKVGGTDPKTHLPKMSVASDGLCHFCKNPE